jgi:hypothetical protein
VNAFWVRHAPGSYRSGEQRKARPVAFGAGLNVATVRVSGGEPPRGSLDHALGLSLQTANLLVGQARRVTIAKKTILRLRQPQFIVRVRREKRWRVETSRCAARPSITARSTRFGINM